MDSETSTVLSASCDPHVVLSGSGQDPDPVLSASHGGIASFARHGIFRLVYMIAELTVQIAVGW